MWEQKTKEFGAGHRVVMLNLPGMYPTPAAAIVAAWPPNTIAVAAVELAMPAYVVVHAAVFVA